MAFLDVSESTAAFVYSISSVAVIVFGILAYWASGKLDTFTDSRITDAKLEIENRKKENLELSLRLESERADRLSMERLLKQRLPHPGEEARTALGPFKPMSVVMESARDPEAEQAARNLGIAMEYAGWEVVEWTHADGKRTSGIWVGANEPGEYLSSRSAVTPADDRSAAARDALIAWLTKGDFKSWGGRAPDGFPDNTVFVSVGPSERYEGGPALRMIIDQETSLTRGPQNKQPTNNKK